MKDEAHLLTALQEINKTVAVGLNLNITLMIILKAVINNLDVDAASVALFNPDTQNYEYAAGQGFRTKDIELATKPGGEVGLPDHITLERANLHIPNFKEYQDKFPHAALMESEGFIGYYGVPLFAKGNTIGVLEVFRRAPLPADSRWVNFLELVAMQTAIAIDNAQLFENLLRANSDLSMAYDATIEGWQRALDLRDKEASGQSRRVTELAVMLAKAMCLGEQDLLHLQRGALLHGIGKMSIPDAILFKPEPLTEAELKVLHMEPVYAYQLLSPIPFLHQAAEVAYCCRENWDGSGYPRGLKGDQIPLAARVVAVALTWDQSSSDQRYRTGMAKEKVAEYMREQSGKTLDPTIVDVFLKMMER